jgi:glycosyltransferase involved in cell wall biosynthesis
MAPFRFAYFMPYMRAAYRALAECPRVTLLNNSRPGAEDYARWLDLPSARIGVLRNGFIASGPAPAEHEVTHYRAVLGIPAGAPLIGAVFRFYEDKDPLLWVRTAAAVIRALPEARFLLVGTGPLADMIRRAAGDLGIADRLVTPGTEQNVRLALASMDVLLLTSKLEGTPNVVLEAQACGVPVVATEAGGTRDAIAGGVTGWCETARDADRLASRIVRALTDHAWRAQARTAGPAFVAERFDIDRMLDETLRSYGWPARQIS